MAWALKKAARFGDFNASLVILAFGLAVGAMAAYILLRYFDVDLRPDYYHRLAQNLISGQGYVIEEQQDANVWRLPLYPFFLAGLYFLFGNGSLPVVSAQIMLNSLSAVLLFGLMRHIFPRGVALLAALAYALYPLPHYYVVRELPVILFTFLLLILLHLMYAAYRNPSGLRAFAFGASQGFATLCLVFMKGFPLFVLLAVAGAGSWRYLAAGRQERIRGWAWLAFLRSYLAERKGLLGQYVKLAVIMLAGYACILSPWILRNYQVTGAFPVIGVGGGFTLWIGNHIATEGKDFDQLSPERAESLRREMKQIIGAGTGVDLKNDQELFQEAIRNFRRYPKESLILFIKKAGRLWCAAYTPAMAKYQAFLNTIQLLILIPAVFGLYYTCRQRLQIGPLLVVLLYFQIGYTIFFATIRYIIPVMPIVITLSVFGASEIYGKLKTESFTGRLAALRCRE